MRQTPKETDNSNPLRAGNTVYRGEEVIRPFVVLALPRSRTAWLSHFLSYGNWHCGHDEVRHMRSLDDIHSWFSQGAIGSVETAVAPWWRLLKNVRLVTIRRPIVEVVDSMSRIPGCSFDRDVLTANMRALDRKLDQVEARVPDVLSVNYSDLDKEEACAALFEHCLPYKHDSARWRALSSVNIQINMRTLIRYCEAYKPALEKLAATATHKIMTELASRPVISDGMTFQTEDFDLWMRDAGHLFAEHCFQIGENPQNWQNKNIPLLKAMFDIGAVQITTARSNGRMFGYLVSLISPSLVSENIMSAINTAFFADPACPGLGMKLQRAALSRFREQGIGEVFWETNVVGGAHRISSIYRRLGAEEKGSVYRLNLAEAA